MLRHVSRVMVSRATCSRLVYDLEVVELEQCGVLVRT